MTDALPIFMFIGLFLAILSGYPVAFALSGIAIIFGFIGHLAGVFYWTDMGFVPNRIFGIVQNYTLVAVPLFVFMGLVLSKSGIAEELLESVSRILGRFKGGLAYSVVIVGAVLAASTGIAGATVVTMGLLTLPTMLKKGYQPEVSSGVIVASGTLGQIIPPSIILVLLGDMMSVDVGDLFMGAIIPGSILIIAYLLYIKVLSIFKPEVFSNNLEEQPLQISELPKTLLPPVFLMIVVLGSILFGIASPTEAASCGAVGALLIGLGKAKLSKDTLYAVTKETVLITSMVFLLLIGAQFFGVVFRGINGEHLITNFIETTKITGGWLLFGMMALLFFLGFFLDFLEICFIVIPIIQPIFLKLGFDPLWIAILIAINLQTSFLTPPFGFALFYLKGVAPTAVSTAKIYRGAIPFVLIQLFVLTILAKFPELVLWLPQNLFSK